MRVWSIRMACCLTAVLAIAQVSEAQSALTKRATQGAVTIDVTLVSPVPGDQVRAKVVLDTHSESLDGIKFEDAVVLRQPDGREATGKVEQSSGSGHHREVVLVFPPARDRVVQIVVKGVGGSGERSFSWELPAR